ncbi:beta-ketoacyl synthase N-terminal-like domain-containing protein [Nonomuraea muscovyensis]|jgi:3-oxoacyl-[acyl-carrier-protein] synthase II|uniref:beta-ketoacyl synthase N-terminal-like domain-containing protein n=1 Tax=Nonomuraea muscovyensis TaxID=1124761 RepID=UPI0033D61E92|nr:beta-ketoacyl synthase [Nonomuraea muscovyensis]
MTAAAAVVGTAVHDPGLDARQVLGRKGLLYKEPATRLALCAVHQALALEPGERPDWPLRPRTAVVACSNLGNVQTVSEVTRAVRAGGVREVSPLAAPNASSNVIASTVALWFRLGGPNLMICSGATAGLDGLAMALRLLRAGRADQVVLVGAEPADEVATALYGPSLRAGAACVLLEAEGDVLVEAPTAGEPSPGGPSPSGSVAQEPAGDLYGAHGVAAVALAARAVVAGHTETVTVTCGSAEDGWRSALVRRRREAPR